MVRQSVDPTPGMLSQSTAQQQDIEQQVTIIAVDTARQNLIVETLSATGQRGEIQIQPRDVTFTSPSDPGVQQIAQALTGAARQRATQAIERSRLRAEAREGEIRAAPALGQAIPRAVAPEPRPLRVEPPPPDLLAPITEPARRIIETGTGLIGETITEARRAVSPVTFGEVRKRERVRREPTGELTLLEEEVREEVTPDIPLLSLEAPTQITRAAIRGGVDIVALPFEAPRIAQTVATIGPLAFGERVATGLVQEVTTRPTATIAGFVGAGAAARSITRAVRGPITPVRLQRFKTTVRRRIDPKVTKNLARKIREGTVIQRGTKFFELKRVTVTRRQRVEPAQVTTATGVRIQRETEAAFGQPGTVPPQVAVSTGEAQVAEAFAAGELQSFIGAGVTKVRRVGEIVTPAGVQRLIRQRRIQFDVFGTQIPTRRVILPGVDPTQTFVFRGRRVREDVLVRSPTAAVRRVREREFLRPVEELPRRPPPPSLIRPVTRRRRRRPLAFEPPTPRVEQPIVPVPAFFETGVQPRPVALAVPRPRPVVGPVIQVREARVVQPTARPIARVREPLPRELAFPSTSVFGVFPARERVRPLVGVREVTGVRGVTRAVPRLGFDQLTGVRAAPRAIARPAVAQRVVPRVAQRVGLRQVTARTLARPTRARVAARGVAVARLRFDEPEEPVTPRRRRRRRARAIRRRFRPSVIGILTGRRIREAPTRPLTGLEVRGVVSGRRRRRRR